MGTLRKEGVEIRSNNHIQLEQYWVNKENITQSTNEYARKRQAKGRHSHVILTCESYVEGKTRNLRTQKYKMTRER